MTGAATVRESIHPRPTGAVWLLASPSILGPYRTAESYSCVTAAIGHKDVSEKGFLASLDRSDIDVTVPIEYTVAIDATDPENFIASAVPFRAHASGGNMIEAVSNLADVIAAKFLLYKSLTGRLSPELVRDFKAIKKHVCSVDCAWQADG